MKQAGIITFLLNIIMMIIGFYVAKTFASGIATGLAQNLSLIESVKRAHKYVNDAIRYAPKLGKGKGPINHLVSIK